MSDVVVVGPGELGRLFAGGALRGGSRVAAVTRTQGWDNVHADPGAPVLVAVPEKVLATVLSEVPDARRDDVILVQNELFPPLLEELGVPKATVAVVWMAKKPGQPELIARPMQVHGRHASTFVKWCQALSVPAEALPDAAGLAAALIEKYAFILAINALGLARPVTVGAWLEEGADQVRAVIDDCASVGRVLCGPAAPGDIAAQGAVLDAMQAMAHYPAKGRTAADRLDKALAVANAHELPVPALRAVKNSLE